MLKKAHFTYHILKEAFYSSKTWITFMLIFIILEFYIKNLRVFLHGLKEPINADLFPFISQQFFFAMIFGIMVIYYYSDAPFMHRRELFFILRIGRNGWGMCQIAAILLKAVILILVLETMQILLLGGYAGFQNTWYDSTRILSYSVEDVILVPSSIILANYSPYEAFAYHAVISVMVVFLFGLLMFYISLRANRILAILLCGFMSVLPIIIYNTMTTWLNYISFVSWLDLSDIAIYTGQKAPTMPYVLSALALASFFLILFIMRYMKKTDFKWEEEH